MTWGDMDFKNWKDAYDPCYDYSSKELAEKWDCLHQWDGEPFPTPNWVAGEVARFGESIFNPEFNGDLNQISRNLISGWIAFHAGRFDRAADIGLKLGSIGHYLASTAFSIYGFYLAEEKDRVDIFKYASALAQDTVVGAYNHLNTYYMYACNLGRWGECVSKFKAVQAGVPLKFRSAILKTLDQDPDHIYARTGLSAFEAMIIGETIASVAKLTFGATKESCYGRFEKILEEAPLIPLPAIQYGRSILMIEGAKKGARGMELIKKARMYKPRDVMEKLDVGYAHSLSI